MSGRYSHASVAGIPLTDTSGLYCRVDLLDAEGLKGSLAGRSVVALDFTVHTLLFDHGRQAQRFGLRVFQLSIQKLNDIVAAMEAAVASGEDFIVTAIDQSGGDLADDINVRAVPDFRANGGKYYQRGALSTLYVRDVTFRFISTAAGA